MSEKALYQAGFPVVDLYAGLMFGVDRVAPDVLPDGPKIFTPNHPSTTDPFLVLQLTSEPVSIVIEERLFKVPVFGDYLRACGHIPVIPGRGREAYNEAVRRLEQGGNIAIFPEGAISPLDGGFHPPRTGAARMALETGAPVIPVGMALDRERIKLIETQIENKTAVGTWYLRGPYAITVGEPVTFNGDVEDRARVSEVSQQIMGRIIDLSTQGARRLQARSFAKAQKAALRAARPRRRARMAGRAKGNVAVEA